MAPFSFPQFFYSQLFTSLPMKTRDLRGQVIIVTGSNTGLGKEAARHLAAMNPARLILAVRNVSKGQVAAQDIIETTKNKNIEVWELDMASFASVKAFAQRVDEQLPRLDIVIENAGIAAERWTETADGYESTLQVNCISTAMLALLLLPKLRASVKRFQSRARIVITGSEVHNWTKFVENESPHPLAQLNKRDAFIPSDRYNVSKLLDVLITREIGEHLDRSAHPEDRSITINCVNPGLCHSELGRDLGVQLTILKFLLARTTEYGSRNLVFAALADQDVQGLYVHNCDFSEPSDLVMSESGALGQKKVWNELTAIFANEAPEAMKVFA